MNDRANKLARAIENERNVKREVERILKNEDMNIADANVVDRVSALFDRLDELEDQIEFLRSAK